MAGDTCNPDASCCVFSSCSFEKTGRSFLIMSRRSSPSSNSRSAALSGSQDPGASKNDRAVIRVMGRCQFGELDFVWR